MSWFCTTIATIDSSTVAMQSSNEAIAHVLRRLKPTVTPLGAQLLLSGVIQENRDLAKQDQSI